MEKKQKRSFGIGPWALKKNEIKNFIPITNTNRKNSIVLGRILYVIDSSETYLGSFSIDPCFTAGKWMIPFKPWMQGFPGHFQAYFESDIDRNQWGSENKRMVDKFIEEKKLFIRQVDPILQFYKS